MVYRQSTSQLFWTAVFEDPKFFESIKNHSRYRLRLIAIISVDLGLFLNILSVCLARNKVLNGLAFLPVCRLHQRQVKICSSFLAARDLSSLACLRPRFKSSLQAWHANPATRLGRSFGLCLFSHFSNRQWHRCQRRISDQHCHTDDIYLCAMDGLLVSN